MKRQVVNEARVLAPNLAVGDATVEQLEERVQSTIRGENQLAGIRVEAVAELRRRDGTDLTEAVLREDGLRSRRRARSEVETAVELSELPKTSEGLRKGEISYDNARIIAGASKRGEIDEDELGDAARNQSPDKFAASVRKYEQQRSEDDGMSKLEHQRFRRYAKIKTDLTDGMVVLYGRFDPITGARMIADYDVITGELRNGRLPDGTPIPTRKIRDLACDAEILPAIFRGASQPLDLGRARRIASPAQRITLVARDRKCIGCGASANWCQAHHIIPWAAEGKTDLDNMCLLCSRCHHKVHDDGWRVRRTAPGQYTLRPPPTQHGRPPRRRNPNHRRHRAKQRK